MLRVATSIDHDIEMTVLNGTKYTRSQHVLSMAYVGLYHN